jgi:hypothetical protein
VRRWILLGSVAGLLALIVAGCGGSSPSAQEEWAGDVCSSISTWQGQVESIVGDVQSALTSPDVGTVSTLKSSVDEGVQATKQLGDDLKSLPPLPASTENGETAKQLVTSLKDELEKTAASIKKEAQSLGSSTSLSELAAPLTQMGSELSGAVSQTKSTIASLQQLAGELKDGFQNADSCKDLTKSQ